MPTNLFKNPQEWWASVLSPLLVIMVPSKGSKMEEELQFIATIQFYPTLSSNTNFRVPENRGCAPGHVAAIQAASKTLISRHDPPPPLDRVVGASQSTRTSCKGGMAPALTASGLSRLHTRPIPRRHVSRTALITVRHVARLTHGPRPPASTSECPK